MLSTIHMNKFDIMIEDDVIGEMNTVNDAITVISGKVAA
jgi:acyl carrier protein